MPRAWLSANGPKIRSASRKPRRQARYLTLPILVSSMGRRGYRACPRRRPARLRLDPGGNEDFHAAVGAQEAGLQPHRFFDDLDGREAPEDLLPDHLQLHLGQAIADAAMDAEAEAEMLARAGTVDDEGVRIVDRRLVAIAGDVPHDHLFTLADGLAAELDVGQGGAAHVGDRCLPA